MIKWNQNKAQINSFTFKTAELGEVFRWHERNVKIILENTLAHIHTLTKSKPNTEHNESEWEWEQQIIIAFTEKVHGYQLTSVYISVVRLYTPLFKHIRFGHIFPSRSHCVIASINREKDFFHVHTTESYTYTLVSCILQTGSIRTQAVKVSETVR